MSKLTPAMQQYVDVKNKYPDCLVLFRMGDFYETFFEDAREAAELLEITLTKRGNVNGQPIPLAGIPYHALETYLARLVKLGKKVAICEQLEDPKLAKGVVKRGVTRVVTPGTIIDEKMLTTSNNFLACFTKDKQNITLSLCDISTGEFLTYSIPEAKLPDELQRWNPSEIIVPTTLVTYAKRLNYFITEFQERHFEEKHSLDIIKEHFGVESFHGLGLSKQQLITCGALLDYLNETQMTSLNFISRIRIFNYEDYMQLDRYTVKNLELLENIGDQSVEASLLWVLDKTKTPMGRREIQKWIVQPLLEPEKVNYRLDGVQELSKNIIFREEVKEQLRCIKDVERLISRISYGNSNPRDIIALAISLEKIMHLKKILVDTNAPILRDISDIHDFYELSAFLKSAIKDEPPMLIREGGFIKGGYNAELDELREISRNSKKIIKEMEAREKAKTGIKSLKISFNRVFGYFIEVTKTQLNLVPETYIRKQTMANAERYITEELKELESKIMSAEEKIKSLEYSLFMEITDKVAIYTVRIQNAAAKIALLDVITSFADVSVANRYVRPEVDSRYRLNIVDGRHPVIEKYTDEFITNSIRMDDNARTFILTGPNMSGKSTYMRQSAIIILMAQIGCFVPAKSAKIGVCDRIFTRVGASDDISSGQSTFMMEMSQTALILNNATKRSFIILDEIGRGTSTFDGVAIAWSVAEYITRDTKCKTLFATHYHFMNKLAESIKEVRNYNIDVVEKDNDVIFLHKVVPGGTDKSYGIHVGKLAGLPKEVIAQAIKVQLKLEASNDQSSKIVVEKKDDENYSSSYQMSLNDMF